MAGDVQAHVRLMTLLNVKAAHPRDEDNKNPGGQKRLRVRVHGAVQPVSAPQKETVAAEPAPAAEPALVAANDSDDEEVGLDAFYAHFGTESTVIAGVDTRALQWTTPQPFAVLGGATIAHIVRPRPIEVVARPHARIWNQFISLCGKKGVSHAQEQLLQVIGKYVDFWDATLSLGEHKATRMAISMHLLSHVTRVRQRILKDNERLAKAAAAAHDTEDDDGLPELRDQGFTRPKVLLLAPMRNSAKVWVEQLIALAGSDQVENKARFFKEFSLPPGALDKLADPASADRYPEDHRYTFQGNIDDNFKLGIKLTRKTLKLYSGFFESDVIVASPLGLRLLMEKEKESDHLSSIEILVLDQMDTMLMQNWEHVKFVVEHLNAIPKQAHDTDFSRVKPWYLDNQAKNLRQNIMLSAFDAPEFRNLFHHTANVGGRVRTVPHCPPETCAMASVTPGIRQTFHRFDSTNAQSDPDVRLQTFLAKILPLLQRSALSATHTMIVVPSYFDFVRIEHHLRQAHPPISYTTLTEYTSNKDISRARQAFFMGKKGFLLMTERFHFYRRYLIRGARNMVFYAPPEHAGYYTELVNAPLTPRNNTDEVPDPADVSATVLYSNASQERKKHAAW
ncbi:Utp25p [Malassezia vespertilionis]|uniref:U3 small nucleolar RNA-associated protein 25 n=1 Tax=Malassezia vespertilionis TaxID=2020962 RepID=A0A2N1JFQ6_9BASI|nr:Utp25p [Malassezia vespertilionis]